MRRRVQIAMLAVAIVAGGCSTPNDEEVATADPVMADTLFLPAESVRLAGFTTAPVLREPWRESWRAPARLTLDIESTEPIGSIVEGRVMKVYAMPGDRVRTGQVLVAVHSHEMMDARAGLARARAERSHAEANLGLAQGAAARGERLFTLKAIALAELERLRAASVEAEALRDGATAELSRAEGMLDHLLGEGPLPPGYDTHWVLIRAPLNGMVTSRQVQPGNVVLAGSPLMTVSRTSSLTLVIQLPDAATRAARVGGPVSFTVAGRPGEYFDARVTRVYPVMDTLTRTLEVHAAVSDRRGVLKPEMFADAEISGSAGEVVTTVPAASVQGFEGDTVVIAARPADDGMFLEAVPVRVGRRSGERVEIVSGIDSGRTVIVGGASIAKAELLKRRGGG